MYLSKLILNPRCREVRRDIQLPYELHRTLARAFTTADGTNYRAAHGVLFRIEPLVHPAAHPTVLVQSGSLPDWHELPEAYLLTHPETKVFSASFRENQVLSFRLLASPTKKEPRPGRQGRRIALSDSVEDETTGLTPARTWMVRKGEQHGFRLIHLMTEEFRFGGGRSKGFAGKNDLPLCGVRFDGLLQITDPVRLLEAIQKGIGPSKAFGFGLLSLAPVPEFKG